MGHSRRTSASPASTATSNKMSYAPSAGRSARGHSAAGHYAMDGGYGYGHAAPMPMPAAAPGGDMYHANPFAPHRHMTPSRSAFVPPSAPPPSSSRHHRQRMTTASSVSQQMTVSSRSTASSTSVARAPANTFSNRFMDAIKAMTLSEIVPLSSFIIANLLHYFKHRSSETMVPYTAPPWMRYVKNTMFSINTYRWLKANGIVKRPEPAAPAAPADGKRDCASSRPGTPQRSRTAHSSHHAGGDQKPGHLDLGWGLLPSWAQDFGIGSHHAASRDLGASRDLDGSRTVVDHHRSVRGPSRAEKWVQPSDEVCDEIVMHMVAQISDSLFLWGPDGTRGGFDDSWAVPRHIAESHYRAIYRRHAGLAGVEAQALGGAAAIKALRSEGHVAWRHSQMSGQAECHHDFMLLGLALSEAQALLARKAEAGPLARADSLDVVAKIAVATVIKIKMDEEHLATAAPAVPAPAPVSYAAAAATCAAASNDYRHATQDGVPPYSVTGH